MRRLCRRTHRPYEGADTEHAVPGMEAGTIKDRRPYSKGGTFVSMMESTADLLQYFLENMSMNLPFSPSIVNHLPSELYVL